MTHYDGPEWPSAETAITVARRHREAIEKCPHGDGNSCEQYRLQDQRCQDCPLLDQK